MSYTSSVFDPASPDEAQNITLIPYEPPNKAHLSDWLSTTNITQP